MRKIFIFVFFTCFYLVASQAQNVRSGSLYVSYRGDDLVQVDLSGPQYFNEPFANNILLSGLLPGEYTLTISLSSKRGRNSLLLSEKVRVYSQQRLIIDIQKNGRFSFQTEFDKNSIPLCPEYDRYSQPSGRTPAVRGPEPLSPKEFDQLMSTVKRAPFDKDKMDILSVSSGYKLFYTEQIAMIMKLFSFDDAKLDCAKMLSDRAYDPQNLYLLGDAFTFSSTKEKYYDYMKGSKNERKR